MKKEDDSIRRPISIHLEIKSTRQRPFLRWLDGVLRRAMDIVVSLVALILLAPTFLLVAAAIKKDSPGPVFYRGRRAGRNGKEFGMLKFRTMYEQPKENNGAKVTAQDDHRITPLGKRLRASKVNELPQLWNVLVGQMSLVGPRPEDPEIVKTWPEENRRVLLSVRPGITSPATVMYRDEESLLSTHDVMQDYLKNILPSKLRLDTLYVRNRSLLKDLDVLLWTAVALLPNMRDWAVPQNMLYWGPVSQMMNRYLLWLVVDSAVAMAAVVISGVIWRINRPLDIGLPRAILIAAGISLFFSLMNWALRLNVIIWSRAPASDSVKLAVSSGIATVAMMYLNSKNLIQTPLPGSMILVSGILAFIGFTAVRYRERLITGFATRWIQRRGEMRGVGERVLIVGSGENGALASWLFGNTSFGQTFSVAGIVDDDPYKLGMRIDGYPVLGTTAEIPRLVEEHVISLILFTIDNIQPLQRARILEACQHTSARVVLLPDTLATLKQDMKTDRKDDFSSGPTPVSWPADADDFLAEVESLLEEGKVEAARHKIAECRQTVRHKDTGSSTTA